MEIRGTVYRILPQAAVTFGDGTTRMKGGFVIMREGDYPKPVAFEVFGEERLTIVSTLTLGMPVAVNFRAESRESRNGGYYTTLRCNSVTPLTAMPQTTPTQVYPAPPTQATPAPSLYAWSGAPTQQAATQPVAMSQENDLPFEDDLPFF